MAEQGEQLSIEQKHRKEKRDLQSKIQSLKKSAGKGDKKKKKEILDEILRLETELETRHLEEISISQDNFQPENVISDDFSQKDQLPKISKAQKRRDKKAAEEKAREEMISRQEEENINGPRNLEIQAIKKLLKERGLMLYDIPSNGDCLYGAVLHQSSLLNDKMMSVEQLRSLTSNHVRRNKDNFLPFLSNQATGDMLSNEEFEDYCDKIANTRTWGGQVELQALSELLKCPINVLQSTLPSVIQQGEQYKGTPLTITYHRHIFGLGEHYNSTQKYVKNDEEEAS